MHSVTRVVAAGSFDDLRTCHIRFLEEASRLGHLRVLVWSDATVQHLTGRPPKFPEEERLYLLEAIRYVDELALVTDGGETADLPPGKGTHADIWVSMPGEDSVVRRRMAGVGMPAYHIVAEEELRTFPAVAPDVPIVPAEGTKVVVTGSFDWLHSGHVRFFEEASELGHLYVVVGHDANIALLKGQGHPMLPQAERRYAVASIRYVTQALVSSGHGWLDAEPEIARLRPNLYVVNEDGDRPEKRAFCRAQGIEYVVFKRLPKDGLPRRESTALRGF
jgi:cytidyltransferase-like protein